MQFMIVLSCCVQMLYSVAVPIQVVHSSDDQVLLPWVYTICVHISCFDVVYNSPGKYYRCLMDVFIDVFVKKGTRGRLMPYLLVSVCSTLYQTWHIILKYH